MLLGTSGSTFAGTDHGIVKLSGPWTGNYYKIRYNKATVVQKYGFNSTAIDEDQTIYYRANRTHKAGITRPGYAMATKSGSADATINYQITHKGGPVYFDYYSYY